VGFLFSLETQRRRPKEFLFMEKGFIGQFEKKPRPATTLYEPVAVFFCHPEPMTSPAALDTVACVPFLARKGT
jgi:hypothetical protein